MSRLQNKTPAEEKPATGEYNALKGRQVGGAFTCGTCGQVATDARHDAEANKLRYDCPQGHRSEIYWKI